MISSKNWDKTETILSTCETFTLQFQNYESFSFSLVSIFFNMIYEAVQILQKWTKTFKKSGSTQQLGIGVISTCLPINVSLLDRQVTHLDGNPKTILINLIQFCAPIYSNWGGHLEAFGFSWETSQACTSHNTIYISSRRHVTNFVACSTSRINKLSKTVKISSCTLVLTTGIILPASLRTLPVKFLSSVCTSIWGLPTGSEFFAIFEVVFFPLCSL